MMNYCYAYQDCPHNSKNKNVSIRPPTAWWVIKRLLSYVRQILIQLCRSSLINCRKWLHYSNFFQQCPVVIGFLLELPGFFVQLSIYAEEALPGQDYNLCYNRVSLSVHLWAIHGDLYPQQNSIQVTSTLLQHSLPHHGCHRTSSSFSRVPKVL